MKSMVNILVGVFALLFVLLVGSLSFSQSFFYFEPFSGGGQPTGWFGPAGSGTGAGFLYGRDGVYNFAQRNNSLSYVGGQVTFNGNIYTTATVDYLGTWVGNVIAYTNRLWNPTPYNPFGFEVLRKLARIDPHNDTTNPESRRLASAFVVYLAQYSNINNSSPAGTKFPAQIAFYDMMRMCDNVNALTTPYSQWGYYVSSYSRLHVTNVYTLTSNVLNIKPIVEWNMDDNWVHTNYEALAYSQNPNSQSINTNWIKIMVTHDGEKARLFLNVNPNNLSGGPFAGIPNAMIFIGEAGFNVKSNIFPMIGIDTIRYDTETSYVIFDDFYIRTIASAVTSEITPYEVATNSTFNLNIFVKPRFGSTQDAGISEIHIKRPSYWTWFNWSSYTNGLAVMVYSNNTLIQTFSKQVGDVNPNVNFVSMSVYGDTLKIRFRATSWADNQIIRPVSTSDYTSKFIRIVVSNVTASGSVDYVGGEFEVYVDNPKYGNTWTDTTPGTAPRYATTGRMKSYAGDALNVSSIDSSLSDGNTLTLRFLGVPFANGGIKPNLVYQGTTNTFFYSISTPNTPGTPITTLKIAIPNGFTLNPNTPFATNISSLDPNINPLTDIRITNENGTNFVYVEYWKKGVVIPGQNGFDRITIKTFGTPLDPTNRFDRFRAYVENRYIAPNVWIPVVTNEFYPSQTVETRRPQAKVEAWVDIQPGNKNFIYNTYVTNRYRYVLKNNGLAGNDILSALIVRPSWLTNITDVVTSIPAVVYLTNFSGSNFIYVGFSNSSTNLPAGTNAVVEFTGWDNVPSLTNDFTNSFPSLVDNGNGDGYIPASESVLSWKLAVVSPNPLAVANISSPNEEGGDNPATSYHHVYIDSYYSDVSIFIQNVSDNNLEVSNDIFMAYVFYPSNLITNVGNFNSSVIQNDSANIYKTNIGGSNFVVLDYFKDGRKLYAGQNDTFTFRVYHDLDMVTNITLKVFADNSTNRARFTPSSNPIDNNQDLHFIYSKVSAKAYVTTPSVSGSGEYFVEKKVATNTWFHIYNTNAHPKNRILKVHIDVPTYFSSNVLSYSSTLPDADIAFDTLNNRIVINYLANGIWGGTNDVINVVFTNHVELSTNVYFTISVSNKREMSNVLPPVGKTNYILVSDPPVDIVYSVLSNVVVTSSEGELDYIGIWITNRGRANNHLTIAKIEIPGPFQGLVTNVVGSWSNVNYITFNNTEITLNYSNFTGSVVEGLPGGGVDYITIMFTNKITNVSTNVWKIQADNSPDYPPMVYVPAIQSNTFITTLALFKSAPTNILSTVSRSIFTNTITVGQGYSVKKIKIDIPYPFVTNDIFLFSSRSPAPTVTIGSNFVILDYPTPIPQNQFDIIRLSNVLDTYNEVTNYVAEWNVYVDYNDGKGFRSTKVDASGTNLVVISYVQPAAEVYVEPVEVGEDFSNVTYTFKLKNIGDPGNEIYEATIIGSPFVTNITSVTSSKISSTHIEVSNNTFVILKYNAAGNRLIPGEEDTITLVGWDKIDDTSSVGGRTNGIWRVRVNNSPLPSSYADALVTEGRSLSNIIIRPSYRVDVYLEMSNSITSLPTDRNKVYSTSEITNVMYYYVFNRGGQGNELEKLFINIPAIGPVINTNGMTVNTVNGSSAYVSNNGEIVVEYSTPLVPGNSDIITISFKDNLIEGETNLWWYSESIFTTTAGKRKTNNFEIGKFGYVSFVMPLPYASGSIVSPSPREVFVSDKWFELVIQLSNTGVDMNRIKGAKIQIPSIFSIVSVSSSNSTNRTVGNDVYVYYTNDFNVNTANLVHVILTNTNLSPSNNIPLNISVWNLKNTNTVSEVTFGSLSFKLVSLPSAFLIPNDIDTSDYLTNYIININNDSSGSRKIKKVRIEIPQGVFSLISNIQSDIVSSSAISTNAATNIIVDYESESKSVDVGNQDNIRFIAYDNIDLGSTNFLVKVYFFDEDTQWREMKISTGSRMDLNFVMPPAYAKYTIAPDYLYVSETSNTFVLTITNEGKGSNKLRKIRFSIPWGFTSVTIASNLLGGIASNSVVDNYVEVYYSNDAGISAGQKDEIYLDTTSYYEILTNVSIFVNTANEYGGNWYVAGIMVGGSGTIRVTYPPLLILSYIDRGQNIYTINTNHTIKYKIINRTRDTYVTNVNFNFDLTNFYSVTITSYLGGVVSTNGNSINISYPSTVFGYNVEDIVTISFYYNLTNFYTIPMVGNAWVYGATNTNTLLVKPSGLSQTAYITNAPFGRVIGYITPYRYPVNVKQVDASGNPVKNSDGNDITTVSYTNNGYFYIAEVYPDDNDNAILVFENENYRPMTKTFKVYRNKNNFIGTIYMLNKPFSKSSDKDQDIVSGDDNKSKVIIKSGNIHRDFSVDIYITNLTSRQKQSILNSTNVSKPSDVNSLAQYFLDVRGYSYDELIKEIGIMGDIILYFYYPSVVSNQYPDSDKLGIYYWKETTGDWIRVGGQVDVNNKFIIAKVSYLHRYYSVLENALRLEGVIRNVTASPKVFTPVARGEVPDPDYGIAKVSFEFDKVYNEYEVAIYSLDGKLVKRFKKSSPEGYANGEIGWDGTDMDGKMVRNGVYIYRIKVADNVYTGTIILVK